MAASWRVRAMAESRTEQNQGSDSLAKRSRNVSRAWGECVPAIASAASAAALHQGQGAGGAESAGGVGTASVGRLSLDVFHATEEDFRVLMFEGGERAAEGILGPALGVGLDGIVKEMVEGRKHLGC